MAARGRQAETEAAPIRYVAELVGADTDSERVIRWLIALMVLCCDPLAIALTAATRHDGSNDSPQATLAAYPAHVSKLHAVAGECYVRSHAVASMSPCLGPLRRSRLSVSPSRAQATEGWDRQPPSERPWCVGRGEHRRGGAIVKFVIRSVRHRVILSRFARGRTSPKGRPCVAPALRPEKAPGRRVTAYKIFMVLGISRVLLSRCARLPVPAARASPDPRSPYPAPVTEGRGLGAEYRGR
jgi:hypothetical protein